MYKVFIKEAYLHLTQKPAEHEIKLDAALLQNPLPWVLERWNSEAAGAYALAVGNPAAAWEEFLSHFVKVEAAGGVVFNGDGELLLIERLGKWDLPKGKMEVGESPEQSAVREVEEECKLSGLQLGPALPTTYHYYPLGDVHVIKPTYWFEMQVAGKPEVAPQVEEGISRVIWAGSSERALALNNTYASIRSLLSSMNL